MPNKRIHGSKGNVKMDPAGGSALVTVASLNEWSLDLKKDKEDVTCFGDLNKVSVLGLPSFEGSLGGFWDTEASPAGNVQLFAAIMGDVAVTLSLIPSTLAPTYFWQGLAWLDGNIKVSAKGAVSIGSTFTAAGNWTMAPAVGP